MGEYPATSVTEPTATQIDTPTEATPVSAATPSVSSSHPRHRRPRRRSTTSVSTQTPSPALPALPLPSLDLLQAKIGITFNDPSLLLEAITHSSFAHENPHLSPRDNERMEHLGDSVLQLAVAEFLYQHRPAATEGELSQTRSAMVNTFTLAHMSEQLGLGDYLQLGRSIASGRHSVKALLANLFEAIVGAVYLDQGYAVAKDYFLAQYRALPVPLNNEQPTPRAPRASTLPRPRSARAPRSHAPVAPKIAPVENFKLRLEEFAKEKSMAVLSYESESARIGTAREYISVVFAGTDPLATGFGPTMETSVQDAARVALTLLGVSPTPVVTTTPPVKTSRPRRRRPRSRTTATVSTASTTQAAPSV